MSRFLLTLCVIAVFSAAAVYAEEVDSSEDDVAVRQGFALKLVQGAIAGWFAGATRNCVNLAAQNCEPNWGLNDKMYNCAKDWFSSNQGRCAFGINTRG